MNSKFTLVLVILLPVFLRNCQSYPAPFDFIFGDDDELEEDLNTTTGEKIEVPARVESANNQMKESKTEPVKETKSVTTAASAPSKSNRVQTERLGNMGVPGATGALSMIASTLSSGVRGLKSVVDGSTNMTTKALQGVGSVKNSAFDSVQDAIDNNATKTLNRVSSWADRMDMYRRALSGTTKKDADKSHSITITTSSDAPVKSLSSFMEKYMPSDSGGAASPTQLPEITSIDFSGFWGSGK